VDLSTEGMLAIGGNRWTKNGKDRVYIEDWAALIDFRVSYYNSGNVSGGSLGEEGLSNAETNRLLNAVDKVYFDVADGEIHIKWGTGSPRYISRDDIATKIAAGIRAAISAAH
jgi:hypothetical protein